MFTCHHCGKVYSDEHLKDCSGHKYCSDCYFKYSLADEQQSVTYTPKPAPQIIKPVDSESTNAQPRENAAEVPKPEAAPAAAQPTRPQAVKLKKDPPMRWYWFYSYVWLTIREIALLLGAVSNVAYIIAALNADTPSGDTAADIGALALLLDIVMLIITCRTASSLRDKLTSTVKDNLSFMIADIVFQMIKWLFKGQDAITIAVSALLLSGFAYLNHIYFRKRGRLFVNDKEEVKEQRRKEIMAEREKTKK